MKKNVLSIVVILISLNSIKAQTNADRVQIKSKTNIENLANLQSRFNNQYIQTLDKAAVLNIPLTKKYSSKSGKSYEIRVLDRIVNGIAFYDGENNVNAAITSKVDKIWNGGASGLNLTGKDIIIGHWEASGVPLSTHVELQNKVIVLEAAASSSHATHTAGTMVGIGVNPLAKGMTSAAIIHARKSNNDEAEMVNFAMNGGILSNHSYGTTFDTGDAIKKFGYYSTSAQEWDQIAYNAPYYLICKSAGNFRNDNLNAADGGYDLLLTKSLAKNILTIGAVKDVVSYSGANSVIQTSFSSYGPTDDWRIKPDLVNNGQSLFSSDNDHASDYGTKSGTSMSTPATVGAIALLQEHYHNKNGAYMKSATVKSLLINSADEVGLSDGPDFANGWGLVNAEKAANLITNNGIESLILEKTLSNNNSFQFTFTVDGGKPLVLSMVWTDPAGNPISVANLQEDMSNLMLVNDLDVRITGNGNTYMPWKIDKTFFQTAASKGDNFRDNVEKIDIASIPSGTYTVTVTHKGQLVNGLQNFSLIINGISTSSLAVKNFSLEHEIVVYPNPIVNKKLYVEFKNVYKEEPKVSIFDTMGKQIKSQRIKSENNKIMFDVSGVTQGIYILKIEHLKRVFRKKIIIH